MSKLDFNTNDVPEDEGFAVVPEGVYAAQIIQTEMKDNKAGTGQYLELRVQLLEDPYAGRLIFERLNLDHPNTAAVAIANRTLRDICNACGVTEIEDSDELCGREFNVKVAIEKAKGDWPESNSVKKYSVS